MKIISVETMRSLDRRTIESGIADEVLMERAARAAYAEMRGILDRRLPPHFRRRFAVIAGKGNNGGDAYVIARLLHEDGQHVAVFATCRPSELKGAAAHHARLLPEAVPVTVCTQLPAAASATGTVLIDGLLGTGTAGPLRSPYDALVRQINATALPVVSIDVPSGINADTGNAEPESVLADVTVTMAQPKQGLLTPPGRARCGILRCVDIGIPSEFVEEAEATGETVFASDIIPLLRRRPAAGHKGTFGRLVVLGGSVDYVGAPMLAGAAALRAGAGLVTVLLPQTARALCTLPLQALIVQGIPDDGSGFLTNASVSALAPVTREAQAVVFGPGLGTTTPAARLISEVASVPAPLVIDADGLRWLASRPDLCLRTQATVVTPHPGEMQVLLKGFGLATLATSSREEQASGLARKSGTFVVLKGLGTVLASPDGDVAINASGTNALATAGTGDVLAGLIGALLAQGFGPWDAIRAGTFIHGYAAELATTGARSLVADDLLDLVPEAMRHLSPFS